MSADDSTQQEEILQFWFGDLEGPLDFDKSKNALWWAGGAQVDAEIRQRFGDRVAQALNGQLDHWSGTPRGALALVILLDQFTRNLGRGTADAFVGDSHALRVTLKALDDGHDQALRPCERSFLCMPLMHAEDRAMADKSLEVFAAQSKWLAAKGITGQPDFHSSAVTHANIVKRFGRYPHRNELLGRASTDEEKAFLADGGPSFGQKKS